MAFFLMHSENWWVHEVIYMNVSLGIEKELVKILTRSWSDSQQARNIREPP